MNVASYIHPCYKIFIVAVMMIAGSRSLPAQDTTDSVTTISDTTHIIDPRVATPAIPADSVLAPHTDSTPVFPVPQPDEATANTPPPDSANVNAIAQPDDLRDAPDTNIVIEGMLLVRETGAPPSTADSVVVKIDSVICPVAPSGEFSRAVVPRRFYIVTVESQNFAPVSRTVTPAAGKTNYFLTVMIDKKQTADAARPPQSTDTADIPWTISGSVIDSRFDIAIESDSVTLLFDGDSIAVSKKGNFTTSTRVSGLHTFFLSIPGYQQVTETVMLANAEKQPFITIPTTIIGKTITRREITVSAKRLPVHRTASVARTDISRKELQRTTATMGDPLRALQTLPGVAAESDVASRPVVRGGDVLESRVFLDGVTLIQPYHFGGVRSTFNQMGLKGLTLYKSGFPAEFHNAQSGIIDASGRLPSDEKPSFEADINYLQYCAYLGIPLFKGKAGINVSSQGSFYDAISKLMYRIIGASSGDRSITDLAKLITLPDYRDVSAGISLTPSASLKIFINEVFNTDRTRFCSGDSAIDYTYHYNEQNQTLLGTQYTLPETTVTVRHDYYSDNDRTIYIYNQPLILRTHDGNPRIGRPYYDIDTMMNYASRYNILYGTAQYSLSPEHLFNLTVAWQKRWWDLDFPGLSEELGKAVYDVAINQYNGNFGWVYSGITSHIVKAGFQLDYTKTRYDVYTVRYLHEMITSGSTNLNDFWGPVNGDTAITFSYDRYGEFVYSLMDRMFVEYRGDRRYYNAGGYLHDSWDITPRLHGDFGARIEYCSTNRIATFSPRLSLRFNLTPNHELIGSAGHYTQDNYDISAIALSKDLKPEKVWHGGVGIESKLLPWLTQKIDIYGKYYYDLLSEVLTPTNTYLERKDQVLPPPDPGGDPFRGDSLKKNVSAPTNPLEYATFRSSYVNDGRGYAFGAEYMLRFDPFDFWHGWISASWGQSIRERREGWRRHPFPLDRPLLLSLHNYYRLPKKYEIGLKYRYMSGLPYTSTNTSLNDFSIRDSISIGAFNDRRYAAYQRFDIRFSKGFSIKDAKGHFYCEIWNSTNAPNLFQLDGRTDKLVTYTTNLPTTILFIGVECIY